MTGSSYCPGEVRGTYRDIGEWKTTIEAANIGSYLGDGSDNIFDDGCDNSVLVEGRSELRNGISKIRGHTFLSALQ